MSIMILENCWTLTEALAARGCATATGFGFSVFCEYLEDFSVILQQLDAEQIVSILKSVIYH